jgi:uncharacterized membrane protein HdeD (DUF308 family)
MHSIPVVDVDGLARNWWIVFLRGLAGILFGLVTFFEPGISLAALVLVFGAYAFVDGVLAIVTAFRRRASTDRWWVLVLEGIAGIGAGLVTLFWPAITAIVLLYLIASWALITGVLEIAAAIRLRKAISNEWLLALSGVVSVILGVLLILAPGPGALAVVIWIGAYAFVFGALLIGLSLRLRSLRTPRHHAQAAHGVA